MVDGGGGEVGALTKVILFPRGQNRIHSVRASFDSRGFYSMKYGNYATAKAGGWERPQIPCGNIFEIIPLWNVILELLDVPCHF